MEGSVAKLHDIIELKKKYKVSTFRLYYHMAGNFRGSVEGENFTEKTFIEC